MALPNKPRTVAAPGSLGPLDTAQALLPRGRLKIKIAGRFLID